MASDTPKADTHASRRRAWGIATEASPRPNRADSISAESGKDHAVLHVNGRGLMNSVSMGPAERGATKGEVVLSLQGPLLSAPPGDGAQLQGPAALQGPERSSSSSGVELHHHHHHHHHHHWHHWHAGQGLPAWLSPRLAACLASPLSAEFLYCFMSAGTTLFNKHALSTFNFPAPNMLLFFQFALAVLLLQALDVFGVIWLQPLRGDLVRLWLPVNLIFVAMNVTGFYALRDIGAGMFTVLKNLSNLMTIAGDYIFFGNTYSWQVWGCLGLMILSALLGGWTDAQFSLRGYAWQLVNCLFTAAYSLYLSGVIRRLNKNPHGKAQLSELSMVYYNNLLSVPSLALLSVFSGEVGLLHRAPQLKDSSFQLVAVVGGLLGFGVSFASIWCMSRTSATIYSLTGSMNKVVVALVGMWYFHEKTSVANLLSIAAGLAAGFLFVFAKSTTTGGRHAPASGGGSAGDAAAKDVMVLAAGPGGGSAGGAAGKEKELAAAGQGGAASAMASSPFAPGSAGAGSGNGGAFAQRGHHISEDGAVLGVLGKGGPGGGGRVTVSMPGELEEQQPLLVGVATAVRGGAGTTGGGGLHARAAGAHAAGADGGAGHHGQSPAQAQQQSQQQQQHHHHHHGLLVLGRHQHFQPSSQQQQAQHGTGRAGGEDAARGAPSTDGGGMAAAATGSKAAAAHLRGA